MVTALEQELPDRLWGWCAGPGWRPPPVDRSATTARRGCGSPGCRSAPRCGAGEAMACFDCPQICCLLQKSVHTSPPDQPMPRRPRRASIERSAGAGRVRVMGYMVMIFAHGCVRVVQRSVPSGFTGSESLPKRAGRQALSSWPRPSDIPLGSKPAPRATFRRISGKPGRRARARRCSTTRRAPHDPGQGGHVPVGQAVAAPGGDLDVNPALGGQAHLGSVMSPGWARMSQPPSMAARFVPVSTGSTTVSPWTTTS
jgi:hypothetical protein